MPTFRSNPPPAACVAEMPVQLWEAEDERDEGQDVRCCRPEGHEGKHSGVIRWGKA